MCLAFSIQPWVVSVSVSIYISFSVPVSVSVSAYATVSVSLSLSVPVSVSFSVSVPVTALVLFLFLFLLVYCQRCQSSGVLKAPWRKRWLVGFRQRYPEIWRGGGGGGGRGVFQNTNVNNYRVSYVPKQERINNP